MKTALLALAAAALSYAGGLALEVGNPAANPEARKLHALLVARVTACHEPAKSTVTARALRMENGKVTREALTVQALSAPGVFAITGSLPGGSGAIEMTVTNPEFANYAPQTLVRVGKGGIEWASLKRFFGVPPTAQDVKALLE
jgi:hypothetical protein